LQSDKIDILPTCEGIETYGAAFNLRAIYKNDLTNLDITGPTNIFITKMTSAFIAHVF
jgi:hypothetical protein